jgi:hypothetical protein
MMNLGIFCLWNSRMVPVWTSAFQSCGGEIGRVPFNARPIGATGALGREGDNPVNHDSVERAVNHQGERDGQHRIAVSNDQRLGLGEAVTAEAIACHQHPQHIITALTSVVDAGKPLPGPGRRATTAPDRGTFLPCLCPEPDRHLKIDESRIFSTP